ncbi:hypothetical protein EDD18DRAFT_1110238, partial [Armillaria luteobubalina]
MCPICFLFWLILGMSLSDIDFPYAAILEDTITWHGGSVVASQLTENSAGSVLMIEAGTSVPLRSSSLLFPSSLTWNYSTVAQEGLDDRTISYARGKVSEEAVVPTDFLGYTRGSDDEYDRCPQAMDPLKSVFPDIARRLTIASYSSSQEPGDKFLFNLDLQGGAIVGLTQSTIGGGGGCGAADAYLRPALDRSNIDLLMGAQVTRLIQKNDTSGVPAFKTVKFAQRANGTRYTLTATKEVILSAGALNTPQILLLSGIGDTDDLEDMGITPTMDLPDVGKNLYDHPQLSNYFVVNSTTTLDEISRDSALAAEYLEEWE